MSAATITRMLIYGGSFAKAIASAWQVADNFNRSRLETAFADLFGKYQDGAPQ